MKASYFLCAALLLSCFSGKAQTDSLKKVLRLSELSLDELMDIRVVTASGYLQKTSEAPSTTQVITARQIKERGYEQLEDALRDVPGIDMIHINGYAPTLIYFRGMYGAENLRALLMIDGIAENNILGSNDMAGPAYSLQNAERIEIIWGPASALYGTNAFGGVINIITKKGADLNGIYGEKAFGSFNTSAERFSMGLRRSKFDLSLSGSLYSTDGPLLAERDPRYSGSYVDNAYSVNGAIGYDAGKHQLMLGFRTYRTPMGWGTYSNSPAKYLGIPTQGKGNVGVIGIMSRDFRDERSGLDDSYLRTLYVQDEFKPNEKLSVLARVVVRETGIGEDSYVYITVDGTKMFRARVASASNRMSGELVANYTLNANHRFFAGLQLTEDNVERGARRTTPDPKIYIVDGRDTVLNVNSTYLPRLYDVRKNIGSYLQYALNTNFLGKTNATIGLRYDGNSYFGNALSPRLVVVNQPGERLTFKLQYGRAFRSPTNLEIYQAALNFKLTTEKIQTYELNAGYAFSGNVALQLNGFRNELRDVIVLGNLTGLNPDKNPGLININGIESTLNLATGKTLSGFVNFTYQAAKGKNRVTLAKGFVPGIAKYKGNAGLTLQAADLFTFTITENWVGKRQAQRTNPYGTVPGYFLTNLTLSTRPVFDYRVTASVSVRNLFDRNWIDPGFRTADGLLYATVLEQPGRNGMIKIGISF